MADDPAGTRPRVGFAGLGNMGAPMAARLAGAGFPLAVLDARTEHAERFAAEHGAAFCAAPSALGERSDVLITMLPEGATVAAVLAGSGGAAETLRPGALVVDMSSSAPAQTRGLARLLAVRDVGLVDAPVSGGVARARTGGLAIIAGGDPGDRDRVAEVLGAMGDRVFHAGPVGCGHAAKALNNAVSAAGLIAAAEALLVGERLGVRAPVLLDILNASTGRNNATENKLGQFVLSRSFASGFELGLLAKDLGIAAAMAADAEVEAAVTGVVLATIRDAVSLLGSQADHTAVVRLLEERAGLELQVDTDVPPPPPRAAAAAS